MRPLLTCCVRWLTCAVASFALLTGVSGCQNTNGMMQATSDSSPFFGLNFRLPNKLPSFRNISNKSIDAPSVVTTTTEQPAKTRTLTERMSGWWGRSIPMPVEAQLPAETDQEINLTLPEEEFR